MRAERISAEQTQYLRHRVLWPHIKLQKDCVIDIDHREDAIHLGTFHKGRIVSICSLFELHTPKLDFEKQYRLRAMATDPSARGLGAGKTLVEFAIELIRDQGYEVIWCDARKVAIGFYKRLGFRVIDEWYEVPKIGPHKLMYYPLD